MSTHTQQTMTNHHATGIWSGVNETLHLWWERHRAREELSHWTERDLHDIGVSRTDVVRETEKPFWRA
jgi:uncharacterized protein YjiS (DUF1127 family)